MLLADALEDVLEHRRSRATDPGGAAGSEPDRQPFGSWITAAVLLTGCGDHEFGLSAQRELLESTPPQVIMVLRHDGHNDPCRAALGAELAADFRALKALLPQGRVLGLRLYEPRVSTPVAALEYAF